MNEPYTQQGTMSNTNNQNGKQQSIRVNWLIKAESVRVISETGENLGVMRTVDAITKAKAEGSDLIEINGKSNPPVCKIQQLGKFKFDEKKKASQLKKTAVVSELKELQLRPGTSDHDISTKVRQAVEFLNEGHRVKWTVRYRGREMAHMDLGYAQLKTVLEMLGEKIVILTEAKAEAKTVSMVVGKEK
jgi:translation initiation factor IF-3